MGAQFAKPVGECRCGALESDKQEHEFACPLICSFCASDTPLVTTADSPTAQGVIIRYLARGGAQPAQAADLPK